MQIRTCPPRHGSPRGCSGLGWLWRSSNPAREQPNASAIEAQIAARTLAELLAQGARGDNAEGCLPLTSCSPSSCRSCSPHSSSPSSKLVHPKSSAAAGPSHGCGFGQPITKRSQCWAQRVPGHSVSLGTRSRPQTQFSKQNPAHASSTGSGSLDFSGGTARTSQDTPFPSPATSLLLLLWTSGDRPAPPGLRGSTGCSGNSPAWLEKLRAPSEQQEGKKRSWNHSLEPRTPQKLYQMAPGCTRGIATKADLLLTSPSRLTPRKKTLLQPPEEASRKQKLVFLGVTSPAWLLAGRTRQQHEAPARDAMGSIHGGQRSL